MNEYAEGFMAGSETMSEILAAAILTVGGSIEIPADNFTLSDAYDIDVKNDHDTNAWTYTLVRKDSDD